MHRLFLRDCKFLQTCNEKLASKDDTSGIKLGTWAPGQSLLVPNTLWFPKKQKYFRPKSTQQSVLPQKNDLRVFREKFCNEFRTVWRRLGSHNTKLAAKQFFDSNKK